MGNGQRPTGSANGQRVTGNGLMDYVTNRAETENCTVGLIWQTLTFPMQAAASGRFGVWTRVTRREEGPRPQPGRDSR